MVRFLLLVLVPVAFAQQAQTPFLTVPPAVSDGLRFGASLPEFEAKDIRGRTWRLDDLRGKTTLIYLWGTGLARAAERTHYESSVLWAFSDLREVQRFQDEVKDSKKIQVLTFCFDYDYTHAPEYMAGTKYTFPVIADGALARKLFRLATAYAVVNSEGRLSEPFRAWSFGRLLLELERQ